MSVNCPITIQFQVYRHEQLRPLAIQHRDRMLALDRDGDDWDRDACRMLEYAAEGQGLGMGPKGEMFTWGSVGNYSSHETFVDALRPFVEDLWREAVVSPYATVVVMFQREQMHVSQIYELALDVGSPRDARVIEVRRLETSFPLLEGIYEREGVPLPGVCLTRWEPSR